MGTMSLARHRPERAPPQQQQQQGKEDARRHTRGVSAFSFPQTR
eukprot:gene2023-7832_t